MDTGTLVNFEQNHAQVPCTDFHPLYHLGGRYYLSTKEQSIELSTGTLHMLPLTIYHIPCKETNPILKTGFGNCPKTLMMSTPIFQKRKVNYIAWTHPSSHSVIKHFLKNFGKPLVFNKTIIHALDTNFARVDGYIQQQIEHVKNEINDNHATHETDTALIIACVALSIATLCLTIIPIYFCCYNQLKNHFNYGPFAPALPAVKYIPDKSNSLIEEQENENEHEEDDHCDECAALRILDDATQEP